MCPQGCKGERARNMPTLDGHDRHTTGGIACGIVRIQHIQVVACQQGHDTLRRAGYEGLPEVQQRLQHGRVRQGLWRQETVKVRVEQHMGNIRASQQRHVAVSCAEQEMVQQGEKPAETRPDHQTALCPTRQERRRTASPSWTATAHMASKCRTLPRPDSSSNQWR